MRWFLDRISVFITLSQFGKNQLMGAGFPENRIVVRPNMVFLAPPITQSVTGEYIAYVGRITPEKGVDVLCEAAGVANLPVRVAGDESAWPNLVDRYSGHVRFEGILHGRALEGFYRGARFLVVPSRWWEVCPIVVLEAMNYGCPVIASRIGGLPELIDDNVTGLLFEPGDHRELATRMQVLWHDEGLRERLALRARQQMAERFSERPYLADLMSIYNQATRLHGRLSA
jgi:glycosyltransferase involved in cell wall biosynthesis